MKNITLATFKPNQNLNSFKARSVHAYTCSVLFPIGRNYLCYVDFLDSIFRKKQLLSAMIPLVIIMTPPVSFNQPFKDITLEGMDHAAQANCYLFTGWTQAHLLRIAHLWSKDKWVKFEGRFFPRDLALTVGFERLRSGANLTSFVSKYAH